MKIFLKMVSSAGSPLECVPIRELWADPYQDISVHRTDEDGKTAFYVPPNSKVKFNVYQDEESWEVVKTVTYEIGGKEDKGKVFTVQP